MAPQQEQKEGSRGWPGEVESFRNWQTPCEVAKGWAAQGLVETSVLSQGWLKKGLILLPP